MPSLRTRSLQLADTFFGQQRVYSPGCITARAGQVYSIGATVDFGFKYRLKLALPTAEPSFDEASGGVTEEGVTGSALDETFDVVEDVSDNEAQYDETPMSVQASSEESLVPSSGVALALYVAQVTLEQRIQDYLQRKLIYCPGSGYDHRDLTIDGVAVDLLPYGSDECDNNTQPSCLMTGSITLYQRFNNAQSSSLQSTQAGLESLRVGMNEENVFEDEDGGSIINVEFVGGVFGVGSPEDVEGRDISLGGIGDLGGGVAVSSIIVPKQNFIQSQGLSLTHIGQGIVAIFAVSLIALVVAKRRKRARYRRNIEESENDELAHETRHQSDEDSRTQDGFVVNESTRKGNEAEDNGDPLESVEVYLVRGDILSRIFGWSKKKIDHVSLSGLK